MNIKIVTNADKTKNLLNKLRIGLNNPKEPLEKSIKWLEKDTQENFKGEGKLYGGWKRLAARTVRERKALGYGGEHPILQRTGKLKGGFVTRVEGNKVATIKNKVEYFEVHQLGNSKLRVPKRTMLDVRTEGINAIIKYFVDWIVNLTKSYL